jgi:hypothetical protein
MFSGNKCVKIWKFFDASRTDSTLIFRVLLMAW